MQTVVETATFIRRADRLLSKAEHDDLIAFLARNPEAGDIMEGAGGVRKLRFAAKGRGKSGGVRVIHYFVDDGLPIYALMIYGKNEKDALSADERNAVRAFAEAIKATRKQR